MTKKKPTLEWLKERQAFLFDRWTRTTDLQRKIRYGARRAEIIRTIDYIETHRNADALEGK